MVRLGNKRYHSWLDSASDGGTWSTSLLGHMRLGGIWWRKFSITPGIKWTQLAIILKYHGSQVTSTNMKSSTFFWKQICWHSHAWLWPHGQNIHRSTRYVTSLPIQINCLPVYTSAIMHCNKYVRKESRVLLAVNQSLINSDSSIY